MARIFDGPVGAENNHSDQKIIFSADGQDRIDLPNGEFIADAQMSRDGQDLVLTSPDGQSVVVEGYFMADPAPVLAGPGGASLSPELVNSFLTASPHYAAADSMSDASPVGAVEELQGKATVTHADGTTEPLSIGSPIYEGDVIETAADGAANIVFADETSMAVSAGARMAVDEYSFDPATESGTTNFSVLRGVFVFTSGLIGRDDPDDVHIETPVGSIGIRGTIIAGNIVPDGESEITVVEGAIVVTNGAMETTLSMQYETVTLTGFNSAMQNQGVLDAQTVSTTYGAVSGVAPTLFSAINDTAAEQQSGEAAPETGNAASDEAVGAPAEDSGETGGETAPVETAPETMQMNQTIDPFTADPFAVEGDKTASGATTLQPLGETRTASGTGTLSARGGDAKAPPPPAAHDTADTRPPTTASSTDGTTGGTTGGGGNTPSGPLSLNGTTGGVSKISDNIGNQIGFSVSAAGDVNDDGYADFRFTNNTSAGGQNHTYLVLGAAGGIPSGSITALSGTVSTQALANPYGGDTSGAVIAGIGDFNGDGVEDYLVGQAMNDTSNFGSGNAFIVSGANPANVISLDGAQSGNNLGFSVAGIGDYNNDGYADVLIGASVAGGGAQGSSYILWGGVNAFGTTVDISTLTGQGATLLGATGNDSFGKSVAGLGDFDGDGHSDIAVGASRVDAGGTDAGRVYIYDGHNPTTAVLQITGAGANHQLGTDVFGIGDFNGDGRSDLMIGAENANPANGLYEAYVVYGGAGTSINVGSIGTAGFKISTPQQIIGGGAAGDFNGDGFDDIAVVLQNGADANVYVVYGNNGNGALNAGDRAYTLADLDNPNFAFKMTYTGAGSLNFTVTSGGDLNGDGFDDLVLGAHSANGGNGEIIVVNGRAVGANYVTDGSAQDGHAAAGTIAATANGQHMTHASGAAHFMDGGMTGVSVAGNNAYTSVTLTNTNFLSIDTGLGNDRIRVGGVGTTLDFTNVNYEQMSGIDNIHFGDTGQTVRLTMENLFNLLKTSDNGELRIGLDGVGSGNLIIDTTTPTGATVQDRIANAFDELGVAATHDTGASAGSYEVFNIGGYTLYIDDAVMGNTAVV